MELLKKLTSADSVNLFFPGNHALGLSEQLYRTDNHTLYEFNQEYPDMTNNTVIGNIKRLPDCEIFQGRDSLSLIIELNPVGNIPIPRDDISDARKSSPSAKMPTLCWVGMQFSHIIPEWLLSPQSASSSRLFYDLLEHVLHLGALQMEQLESDNNLLIDPLTCLPSRSKFQSQVSQLFNQHHEIAVFMVHAAEFHQINKKFGHEEGDKVIWEISQNLLDCIRENDLVSRFGGALFAVAVAVENTEQAQKIADKIQSMLQQPDYLSGALNLGFDIGTALGNDNESFSSVMERVTGLINRADQALKVSQKAPSPSITLWQPDQMDVYYQQQDYIGGIFTADTATDYRNMLLLWDISNIIASQNHFDKLLINVIERLSQTFSIQAAGVVIHSEENGSYQTKAFVPDEHLETQLTNSLPQAYASLGNALRLAVESGEKTNCIIEHENVAFSARLDETTNSYLFFMGREAQLMISHDTQMLFSALSKQIGRAHARLALEERLNLQLEQQKDQLQQELSQLRDDIQSTNMYYSSKAMDELMLQAKRAAQSDTTTLIIGESGTGKERLVKSLHKMGSRRDKPLIVVDCGAIPETLIESELFGPVKGAFTGAQASSKGKVQEADGGTIMLDEIGELPLQMQTKLLRFVQEKTIHPSRWEQSGNRGRQDTCRH